MRKDAKETHTHTCVCVCERERERKESLLCHNEVMYNMAAWVRRVERVVINAFFCACKKREEIKGPVDWKTGQTLDTARMDWIQITPKHEDTLNEI